MFDSNQRTDYFYFAALRAFLCGFVLAVFAFSNFSYADILKEQPAFNYSIDMTKKEFEANSVERIVSSLGDDSLAFKVRLRENWEEVEGALPGETSLSRLLFKDIAEFVSPPLNGERASFLVRAMALDHFIDTKNWFLGYVLSKGYALIGLDDRYKTRLHAEYVVFEGAKSYTVHAVIQKNGDKIILAEFKMPSQFAERNKGLAVRVINSFRVLNKSDVPPVALKKYTLLDVGEYSYPENWTAQALQDPSMDIMSSVLFQATLDEDGVPLVNVRTHNGEIENYLLLKSVYPDPQKFIEGLKIKVQGDKTRVLTKEKSIKLAPNKNTSMSGAMDIYSVEIEKGRFIDYGFRVAKLETAKYWFVSTLITPAQSSSFDDWSRNTAVHDVVYKSFSLY